MLSPKATTKEEYSSTSFGCRSMKPGQVDADIRVFIDENDVAVTAEIGRFDPKRNGPVRIGDRSLTVPIKEWPRLQLSELKAKLYPTLPGTAPGAIWLNNGKAVPLQDDTFLEAAGWTVGDNVRNYVIVMDEVPGKVPELSAPSAAVGPVSPRAETGAVRLAVRAFKDGNTYTLVATTAANKPDISVSLSESEWLLVTWAELAPRLSGLSVEVLALRLVFNENRLVVQPDDPVNRSLPLSDDVVRFQIYFTPGGPRSTTKAESSIKSASPKSSPAPTPKAEPARKAEPTALPPDAYRVDVTVEADRDMVNLTMVAPGTTVRERVGASIFNGWRVRDLKTLLAAAGGPALSSGGMILDSLGRPDSIFDSSKITNIGLDSSTRTLIFRRETVSATPPAATAASPAAASATSTERRPQTSSTASSSNARSSQTSTHARQGSTPASADVFARDLQVPTEIRVFVDGDFVNVSCQAGGKHLRTTTELRVRLSEWSTMTVGKLKSMLGPRWPLLPGGLRTGTVTPERFNDDDTLVSLGIIADEKRTSVVQVVFDLSDVPNTQRILPEGGLTLAKEEDAPAVWRPPVQQKPIEVEIRLFLDNGMHNLALRGRYIEEGPLGKKTVTKEGEVSVADSDWPSFTWQALKRRLHGWPQTKDGGYLVDEKHIFTDSATLKSSSIVGDEVRTKRYVARWDIDDSRKPEPSGSSFYEAPRSTGATTSSSVYSNYVPLSTPTTHAPTQSQQRPRTTHTRTPSATPTDELLVELRIFSDGDYLNLNLVGKGAGLNAEVSIQDTTWPRFTWGLLKRSLPGNWPKLKDGGVAIVGGTRHTFFDGDCLEDSGLRYDPDRTTVFDILFHKA